MIELLVLMGVSFVSALAVGYAAAGAEVAAEKVKQTSIGQRIGQWIFLMPLWEGIDNLVQKIPAISEVSPVNLRLIGDVDILKTLLDFVFALLRTAINGLLVAGALWLIFWIMWLILLNYFWHLVLVGVLLGVFIFVTRHR